MSPHRTRRRAQRHRRDKKRHLEHRQRHSAALIAGAAVHYASYTIAKCGTVFMSQVCIARHHRNTSHFVHFKLHTANIYNLNLQSLTTPQAQRTNKHTHTHIANLINCYTVSCTHSQLLHWGSQRYVSIINVSIIDIYSIKTNIHTLHIRSAAQIDLEANNCPMDDDRWYKHILAFNKTAL